MTAVLEYLDILLHFFASSVREFLFIGFTPLFLKNPPIILELFLILLATHYSWHILLVPNITKSTLNYAYICMYWLKGQMTTHPKFILNTIISDIKCAGLIKVLRILLICKYVSTHMPENYDCDIKVLILLA